MLTIQSRNPCLEALLTSIPRLTFAPASVARPSGQLAAHVDAEPAGIQGFGDGYVLGSAIGASLGTVSGAILGGLGSVGGATWYGASLGSNFGIYGAISGGVISCATTAAEERYLGLGTKACSMAGFVVGTTVGGVLGGVIAMLHKPKA